MTNEEAAYWMLQELLENRLTVQKLNGKRLVASCNCQWYREFCSCYLTMQRRKLRTFIKRKNTVRALERELLMGTYSTSLYTMEGCYLL